jgi:hypothetical protein
MSNYINKIKAKTMKQLFRHTSTLLRTVMLFGAIAISNIQPARAQTAQMLAAMPDAFETMDPASIIGDGQYYYVQFYPSDHSTCSYLTDRGVNKMVAAKDFLPNANNRLWTLEAAGDGDNTHFRLKNKDHHYLCFGSFESKPRVGCVDNVAAASILTYYSLGDGYDISTAARPNYPMYRNGSTVDGIHVGQEWATEFPYNSTRRNSYANSTRMRFAKLKSNSAFIIYYRGEGADNSNPNATTTRHYLTYSGTGNAVSAAGTLRTSDVSSRTSVYRSDEPLWKLPTIATYHEDGLWTLEPSPYSDEAFYIKKYGTNDYLLNSTDGNNIGVLGAKDAINASYRVEDNTVNRYTPIVKVNYTETPLTKDMFHKWDGDGNGATVTENSPAVDFNVGNGASLGTQAMVAGTSNVDHLIYADLSEYSKMVINGTQDMQLRVLMSRQESNNGPWVEKNVTIGSDGKAIVDLTNLALTNGAFATQTGTGTVKMTYVDYNNPDTSNGDIAMGNTAKSGCNKISGGQVDLYNSSWGVNYVTYLQVDASAIPGEITKVTLKADVSGSMDNIRNTCWGVGYNSSNWSSDMTWNTADRTITTLGETVWTSATSNWATTFENKEFDITAALTNDADKKVTILVYETQGGGGYIKNPAVEVEYTPRNSDVNINFAHLNAIKTGNGGPTNGTISSITLLKETGNRYLHYSKGDGWQVEHWTGKHTEPYELWDAAFYPVAMPESEKDEFYKVLLGIKPVQEHIRIPLTRTDNLSVSEQLYDQNGNLYSAKFTPNGADYQRAFRHTNLNTGSYKQIVIKFGDTVPAGWQLHTYGAQFDDLVTLADKLGDKREYVITLQPGRAMEDFTIYNTDANADPLIISEIYYTPDLPAQMVNYQGGASPYSELGDERILWELEQIKDADDLHYHYRLKNPRNGTYLTTDQQGNPQGITTDPAQAGIYTNQQLIDKYYLRWFIPEQREIDVSDREIIHRESYLREYADNYPDQNLGNQGLVSDKDSDWKYADGEQKTNHFEITHYIQRDASYDIEFPTVLNGNNDHRYYQRFFNQDEDGNEAFDVARLKDHLSLNTNGNVQYYLYKNGIVTGETLYWPENTTLKHSVQSSVRFTNTDGQPLTVVADVSRYSDYHYENDDAPLDGNLVEPSLTMRYVFFMNDAKDMANRLTACTAETGKWLEEKTFHFPSNRIFYNKSKWVGYRGQFIPIRHVFSDYWVYNDPQFIMKDSNGQVVYDAKGQVVLDTAYIRTKSGLTTKEELEAYLDRQLVSAVINNDGGRIVVELEEKYPDQPTGIRLGGWNPTLAASHDNNLRFVQADFTDAEEADFRGFYFYDRMYNKTNYGNSRFMAFRYPPSADGVKSVVNIDGQDVINEAYLNMYLVDDNGRRYQLARFTLIFDPDSETIPWTSVNGSAQVKGNQKRDPRYLVQQAGEPIARVTFDYPAGTPDTYQYPTVGTTLHDQVPRDAGGSIANSSPLPLSFDHTNYSFDGDNCNWGAYAMVTQKRSVFGNDKIVLPANDLDYGYGLASDQRLLPDAGRHGGFMYIDASEQPGDICAIDFEGEFCPGDQLMCSGWITGSNKYNDTSVYRCPGGVTLTVKGENAQGKTETIYRFVPGQCYELDNGTGIDGSTNSTHVVWQQFFFTFHTDKKYERYWLEVNNNCVSSNGGDFMLDNIEVYTVVPEVIPDINTPFCVSLDENGQPVTDMRLLKLEVEFNKLRSSANLNVLTEEQIASLEPKDFPEVGFVFLEKDVFLRTFRDALNLDIPLDTLAQHIKEGRYDRITDPGGDYYDEYQAAFNAAMLGSKTVWHSKNNGVPVKGAGVLYFRWNPTYEGNPLYSFDDAVNKRAAVFRYTNPQTNVQYLVLNGNFPELPWKTDTDYYIVPTNATFKDSDIETYLYEDFNICSECSRASVFRIEPPYHVLGLESSDVTGNYVVCEGQVPTMLLDLKGYDLEGSEVDMQDLNYDWWLGNATTKATLEKYHQQTSSNGVRLDKALAALRVFYPTVTSMDGVLPNATKIPNLTQDMIDYLTDLVRAGDLVLHQKSISVPAEKASDDDPYFYLVACPIHDEMFDQALNVYGTHNAVTNSTMEGSDVSCFYMGAPATNGVKVPATVSAGEGFDNSRGVTITSDGGFDNNNNPIGYDTQFLIRAKEIIPIGTKFRLKFRYKADQNVSVGTQAHSEPGSWNTSNILNGNLNFTTEWKLFDDSVLVTNAMGRGEKNNFQTIAFDLWTGTPVNYYFDDVELSYYREQYVAYFCDEPQGLRIKVGEKAPLLRTGFVPYENGFSEYHYPSNGDPVLSIRLAKKAQFMTVQHGLTSEEPVQPSAENGPDAAEEDQLRYLWLPIRNAVTQTASGVIRKTDDYNVYLASTNDPTWDKKIYTSMSKGSLPIVGKIVQLYAINTSGGSNLAAQNEKNRLCIYFTENFDVREGYNYTLSLPFREDEVEGVEGNACDGTILISLKIVPDYEVWTGAAGNTDWNNDDNWRRADGNTEDNSGINADELYVGVAGADSPLSGYKTNKWNYRSSKDRVFRKGFAPLYCTHVLLMTDEWGNAPVLYDGLDSKYNENLLASPFPNLRDQDGWNITAPSTSDDPSGDPSGDSSDDPKPATATPILRYDMQARLYDIWPEAYGEDVYPNKGREGDLIAEMYQINSCDEIAFQPGTELRNAHLLNYNNAWVEYQLDNKRWYLLGSPLQGTISGEWYAPTGNAKQKTTYYDPVRFSEFVKVPVKDTDNPSALGYYKMSGQEYVVATETAPVENTDYYIGYDRYSPAIYQRSWDKAKAVLYEVGSEYGINDDSQKDNLGTEDEGIWSSGNWPVEGSGTADEYLDRLGYKPMGANKANVAIKGVWSNTYNDATVDYANGGFSVMVMNHLKNNDRSGNESIVRLPKEDTMYDYYKFEENGGDDGGTDTDLSLIQGDPKKRALNRGRLKTDNLLPASTKRQEKEADSYRYGDRRTYTRIPIKEEDLKTMNGTFVDKDADSPATAGFFAEAVSLGASNLGFYLVENPFPCGLDMDAFFTANPHLLKKYWLLTATSQHLVQRAADMEPTEWVSPDGSDFVTANAVLPPGQGFFVEADPDYDGDDVVVTDSTTTITFKLDMQAQSRYGVESGSPRTFNIEVGQTQEMEPLYEDVDLDGDGIYGETGITVDGQTVDEKVPVYEAVDLNGNGIYGETYTEGEGDAAVTVEEKVQVMVPKYEKDADGNYVLDADGNKIPILTPIMQDVTLYTYVQTSDADYQYPLRARTAGSKAKGRRSTDSPLGLVVTARRGELQSSALVMVRETASDDFLPEEDTETFISIDDLKQAPTVYTLCGRLATTINSIQDFTCLPLGVESASDAPCTLTFEGVEQLGDSVAFYDAVERKLTPLESGKKIVVSGQTQNRYYLVRSLIQEEAAAETHLQIFTEGLTATVIASTEEPIDNVRCYDTAGRLVITAKPQTREYSFTLPQAGVYIIDAQTENDRKTKKVMAK